MKNKLIFLLFALFSLLNLSLSQPVITSVSHALLAGENNPMTLCEYMAPGASGNNITWDFSGLKQIEKFTGILNLVVGSADFPGADTELDEFGTSFYFEINETTVNQVGYASKDRMSKVLYDVPYEKMIFPLSYGSKHEKDFAGSSFYDNKLTGKITGTGTISADAWGTLILPNQSEYKNTLRVKSEKKYTIVYNGNSSQEFEVISYRWYNSLHRYPLLVLTEYKNQTTGRQNVSINYQAAYNNNAVTALDEAIAVGTEINLIPNPVKDELKLVISAQTNSKSGYRIFDLTGKLVYSQSNINLAAGENIFNLSDAIVGLKPGYYVVKVQIENKSFDRQFIIIED